MPDSNGIHVNDFLIQPGQWRPQCHWENIAWISPPWPSTYYLWLDVPEAIFCNIGNLYLSHVNNEYPLLHNKLPRIDWEIKSDGIFYERVLPNNIAFGIDLKKEENQYISMTLHINNGSNTRIENIHIQTCAYMRGIKEFSECTWSNKYVLSKEQKWQNMDEFQGQLDYRSGDIGTPLIVTKSSEEERLCSMTWFKDSGRIWSNPQHPCIHTDPFIDDLAPGDSACVEGALIFFEGNIADFYEWFCDKFKDKC